MKDKISIERLNKLHPKAKPIFEAFITEAETSLNITLRISQGLRTIKEQDDLYSIGRTKPGKIVTNAKGGDSYHNYGLAIDLVKLENTSVDWNFDYSLLLPIANKYNIQWGGNFKTIIDKPHFELTFNHTIKNLKDKLQKNVFIPNTNYISL